MSRVTAQVSRPSAERLRGVPTVGRQPWIAVRVGARVVGIEVDEAALDEEVADLEDVAPAPGVRDPGAPLAVLVLAVAAAAYLASVYLVWDARRLDDNDMVEYFRRRAVIAAAVVGLIGIIGIFVLRADAPYLFQGLTSRALPLVIVGALCGVVALVLLIRNAPRGARLLAVVAVAITMIAWGDAQWPYILPESLTFAAAAAPSGTLTAMLIVVVLAALIVIPGFVLLFILDQKGLLPEEGVEDETDVDPAGLRTQAHKQSDQ